MIIIRDDVVKVKTCRLKNVEPGTIFKFPERVWRDCKDNLWLKTDGGDYVRLIDGKIRDVPMSALEVELVEEPKKTKLFADLKEGDCFVYADSYCFVINESLKHNVYMKTSTNFATCLNNGGTIYFQRTFKVVPKFVQCYVSDYPQEEK